MSEVDDPERYELSARTHEAIFREEIVPEQLAGAVPQKQPTVVFVGGQPGAGKTATTDSIKRVLDERGGAAHVCGDFYKPYHPDYDRLLRHDDRTAGAYTRIDTRQWHAEVETYVREHRYDAVVETALADPEEFLQTARQFRAAGYRIEVAALAVPESASRLGIVDRYQRQIQTHGQGRFVARENHDACYQGMVDTAARIDREHAADTVFVFQRGNHAVYANHRSRDGPWNTPPRFAAAIQSERDRPWTARESHTFCADLTQVARHLPAEWQPELTDIAHRARRLATPATPLMAAASGHAYAARYEPAEPAKLSAAAFPASPPAGPTTAKTPTHRGTTPRHRQATNYPPDRGRSD